MQENDFEKQIKDKLDQLYMKPSGEVWEKVAAEVGQKRKRRVFYIMFPAAALLLGIGIWWLTGYPSDEKITAAKQGIPSSGITTSTPTASDSQVSRASTERGNGTAVPANDLATSGSGARDNKEAGSSHGNGIKTTIEASGNDLAASGSGARGNKEAGSSHRNGIKTTIETSGNDLATSGSGARGNKEAGPVPENGVVTGVETAHPGYEGTLADRKVTTSTRLGNNPSADKDLKSATGIVTSRKDLAGKNKNTLPNKERDGRAAFYGQDILAGKETDLANTLSSDSITGKNTESALSPGRVGYLHPALPGLSSRGTSFFNPDSLSFVVTGNTGLLLSVPVEKNGNSEDVIKRDMHNPWTFAVNISGGAAMPLERFEKSTKEEASLAQSTPVNTPMRPSMISPNYPAVTPPASEPGASFLSYTAAAMAGRKFGSHFKLSAGLQYAHFVMVNSVGEFVDQSNKVTSGTTTVSVNNYYKNGTDIRYRNKYHFVEIPVEAAYTFNPASRKPIAFLLGFGTGYLAGTNGLHYTEVEGLYYKNIDSWNRLQFSVHTGATMALLSWKGKQLEAGPVLRLNLTNNRFQTDFSPQHLTYMGLRVGMNLN